MGSNTRSLGWIDGGHLESGGADGPKTMGLDQLPLPLFLIPLLANQGYSSHDHDRPLHDL
jgi:hypothetical protein